MSQMILFLAYKLFYNPIFEYMYEKCIYIQFDWLHTVSEIKTGTYSSRSKKY